MRKPKLNKPLNKKILSSIFNNYQEIDAVYLFGSYARGDNKTHSDIDLAAAGKELDEKIKLSLLTQLAKQGYCNVDLVLLENADLVTRYEVVNANKLIYSKADFDHGSYFSKIIRQYFDIYPFLKIQRMAYKNRALNG